MLNVFNHEPPKPGKSEGNLILHCENYSVDAVTVKLIQVDLVIWNIFIFLQKVQCNICQLTDHLMLNILD